jgi:hypothetical protein
VGFFIGRKKTSFTTETLHEIFFTRISSTHRAILGAGVLLKKGVKAKNYGFDFSDWHLCLP